jgi:hypothetical protein
VHVPGLDNGAAFARTGAAGVLDIGQSLRRDQPIVMTDEASARRVAIFSELDANATSPQSTDLLIHPAATLADCYLITCGTTATTGFHYSSNAPGALPTQRPGNVAVAPFECIIPSSAGAADPARVSLYGHGLFGDYTEVEDPWVKALATG